MTKAKGHRKQGTSLIEVLVVIVVFAVGILAVMQIFPGGLRVMADQRDRSVAQQLGKSTLQREDGRTEGFPEQIQPVTYTNTGSAVTLTANPNQKPDSLGLGVQDVTIDSDGIASNGSGQIGNWLLISGPNIYRRVINEGHRIPSPRQIQPSNTTSPETTLGGLLVLNYGPCLTSGSDHASGLTYSPMFDVIGSDMVQYDGAADASSPVKDYVYYVDSYDTGDATLYLPASTLARTYEIRLGATIRLQSTKVVHEDVAFTADVPAASSASYYAYVLKDEAAFKAALHTGDTLLSIDKESVNVARQFTRLTASATFSSDPYEYKLVNWALGMILFNPAGCAVMEERPQGRVPLKARISYDVYDWRILKDDIRVPDYTSEGAKVSLPVRNLRVLNHAQPDGRAFTGMNVAIPDYDSANTAVIDNYLRDFAIFDTETGAAILPTSYSLDYSRGVLTFNNTSASVIYPGDTAVSTLSLVGHTVRVLYMAEGDYSVQLQKAPANYVQAYDTPGIGEFFVGGTKASASSFGVATRIYFPWSDLGQSVRFDRISYLAGTEKRTLTGQSLQITSNNADSVGPFVDIRTLDGDATSIDLTDGYGVIGMHGASLSVRTLWNRYGFSLGSNTSANAEAADSYRQSYKSLRLTTSFMGGEAL